MAFNISTFAGLQGTHKLPYKFAPVLYAGIAELFCIPSFCGCLGNIEPLENLLATGGETLFSWYNVSWHSCTRYLKIKHLIQQHSISKSLHQTCLITTGWFCQMVSIVRNVVVHLSQCRLLARLKPSPWAFLLLAEPPQHR